VLASAAAATLQAVAAERDPVKRPRQLALWPTARTAAEQVFDGRAALAAHLSGFRERRGLTQAALAERAGMDRSYLSGIERGRHNVPLDTVCRLAWALGMEVRDLLTAAPVRKARRRRPASE
jgi:DNA-binding XRE family transcriptional regulator